jgi:TonB family protein
MNKLFFLSTTVSMLFHVPFIYGLDASLFNSSGLLHNAENNAEAIVYYIAGKESLKDIMPQADKIPAAGKQTASLRELFESQKVADNTAGAERSVKIATAHKRKLALKAEFLPTVENINLENKEVKKIFFAYYDLIRQQLIRNTIYPLKAKLEAKEGLAYLSFVLKRDGTVSEIMVLNSSGEPLLDEAAMNSIRNASPFPPFPENLVEQEIKLNVPISFELE